MDKEYISEELNHLNQIKIMLFHKHTYKTNKVDDKGYQYCDTCGKAIFIGLPKPLETWETIEKISKVRYGSIKGYIYIQQSNITGELKKVSVSSEDFL